MTAQSHVLPDGHVAAGNMQRSGLGLSYIADAREIVPIYTIDVKTPPKHTGHWGMYARMTRSRGILLDSWQCCSQD